MRRRKVQRQACEDLIEDKLKHPQLNIPTSWMYPYQRDEEESRPACFCPQVRIPARPAPIFHRRWTTLELY